MSTSKYIPVNHARDYLRQHFAVENNIDPMDFRPLGSVPDGDPKTRAMCFEVMEQCRERAHGELAGCIQGGKITVYGAGSQGLLHPVAADYAVDCMDGKPGFDSRNLCFDRDEFAQLVRAIASPKSKAYLSENYGGLWCDIAYRPIAVAYPAIRWSDYSDTDRPHLEALSDAAARDEWWTWPEALAWIGERSFANVATLRHWAKNWSGDGDQTVILSAQVMIAKQYGAVTPNAEAELLNAIQCGLVGTSGRLSKGAVATDLQSSIWRGGTVVWHDGETVLVDARQKLTAWAFDVAIRRKDLVATFQPEDSGQVDAGGNVPANRKLNHHEIIQRAETMRAAQPGISKGSAAASIVADLPHNPKTGKPRDTRHIERMIAHLWEGGLSQSPR